MSLASRSGAPLPPALRAAAGVLGAEAVAGIVAGVGFGVAAVAGRPADRTVAITLAALLLVLGGGLAAIARGLWRRRPAAQTPAWLAQFFAVVVAYYQRHTLVAVTVALVVAACAAVAALAAPASRSALRR